MRAVSRAELQPLAAVRAAVAGEQHRRTRDRQQKGAPDRPRRFPCGPVVPNRGIQKHRQRRREQANSCDFCLFEAHAVPLPCFRFQYSTPVLNPQCGAHKIPAKRRAGLRLAICVPPWYDS